MKYLIIGMLAFVAGCPPTQAEKKPNPYKFKCSNMGEFISRCENVEVICYKYWEGGISCSWK